VNLHVVNHSLMVQHVCEASMVLAEHLALLQLIHTQGTAPSTSSTVDAHHCMAGSAAATGDHDEQ
jgi:hypothetical protein